MFPQASCGCARSRRESWLHKHEDGDNSMKKLQVLGTGCPSCQRLAELTSQAAAELNVEYELEKVSEIDRIMAFDVPGMPALVVDGELRVAGRVPSLSELKEMIK